MLRVWKYTLPELNSELDGQFRFEIEMPKGAEILNIQYQDKRPQMWALVNTDQSSEVRRLYSVGTGFGEVLSDSKYIATIKFPPYFWHIFEDLN